MTGNRGSSENMNESLDLFKVPMREAPVDVGSDHYKDYRQTSATRARRGEIYSREVQIKYNTGSASNKKSKICPRTHNVNNH